ncbi:CRISPR-associated protein Cas5, partial [bacterium]|nr:CRISPR-associated protein Cas5 [bacterium]
MDVLKIVAEGVVTSFRYPHFMQGVQPTYELPPPATIYGHVCSTLGKWIDPAGVEFAFRFTYETKFHDMEHVHILTPSTGKLKGTTIPKVMEGNINPFSREMLFKPHFELYLNRPEWSEAFLNPTYPVILGRSQDLFVYRKIETIKLEKADSAYFEGTLAPYEFAKRTGRGVVVLMPR